MAGQLRWLVLILICGQNCGALPFGNRDTVQEVYIANGSAVLKLTNLDSDLPSSIPIASACRAVGLGLDEKASMLVFSDVHPHCEGIYRVSTDGRNRLQIIHGSVYGRTDYTNKQRASVSIRKDYKRKVGARLILDGPMKLVKEEANSRPSYFKIPAIGTTNTGRVTGLALDWVSQHIYWTDEGLSTIEISDYEGNHRAILLESGLRLPRGIAVDPIAGFLFWADQGIGAVERSCLDGSDRKAIATKPDVDWPNQLANDHEKRVLYWANGRTGHVMAVGYSGQNISVIHTSSERVLFGLAVNRGSLYVSSWHPGSVKLVDIDTAQVKELFHADVVTSDTFSVAIASANCWSPVVPVPCSSQKCSHLCVATSRTTARCLCPSYGALSLAEDQSTCAVPKDIIVYSVGTGDRTKIRMSGLRNGHEIGRPTNVIASGGLATQSSSLAFDDISSTLYWSAPGGVYRTRLGGGQSQQVFVKRGDAIDFVEDMTIDSLNRQLYIINQAIPRLSADGVIYKWGTIDALNLETGRRKTLIFSDVGFASITLDKDRWHLYYIEKTTQSDVVVCSRLDGSRAQIVLAEDANSDFVSVVYDNGKVYLLALNTFSDVSSIAVIAGSKGRQWHDRVLEIEGVDYLPRSLAVHHGKAYITGADAMTIVDVNGEGATAQVLNSMRGIGQSHRIVAVSTKGLANSADSCEQHGNSEVTCFQQTCSDDVGHACCSCLCRDGSLAVELTENNSCQVPDRFLLYADVNTVKILNLDNSSRVFTLLRGPNDANYVAIAYDPLQNTLFISDVTGGSLSKVSLETMTFTQLITGDIAIEDVYLELQSRMLYFVAYSKSDYKGYIARAYLNDTRFRWMVVYSNLYKPRALTVDVAAGLVFWTELGMGATGARVFMGSIDGAGLEKSQVKTPRMGWPNSLLVTNGSLIIGDGMARTMYYLGLDDWQVVKVIKVHDVTNHIFDMALSEDTGQIYFTSWFQGSVNVVNTIETDSRKPVVGKQARPTRMTYNCASSRTGVILR